MNLKIKSQRGFTLIEMVIVSALAAVLAGGLIGFYGFNMNQVREGVSQSLLQEYYEGIAGEIGRQARQAACILDDGAGEVFTSADLYLNTTGAQRVLFYNESGTAYAGYWLHGSGVLREWDAGTGTWQDFSVGPELVNYLGGGGFDLPDERKGIRLGFSITRSVGTVTDTLPVQGEFFACRN